MTTIQLLDCTLRDGGYLVDKHFNENIIHNIIVGLTQAGVDYVEIGFLQDEIGSEENVCFRNSVEARKYIPQERGSTLYTAFADYSRYSVSNLDEYDGRSFDCIRACFFKEERKEVLAMCLEIMRKGYKLFVQPVGILRYTTSELLELIADFNEIGPFCFGIVDTFGSMDLEDLQLKLAIIHSEMLPNTRLGFHSHSNKRLSDALSQEFIRIMKGERDICIDATLSGMGRGAGNACTELIADYLNRRQGQSYSTDGILDIIDNCITGLTSGFKYGYDIQMYLAGVYSSHINNVNYLVEKTGLRSKDIGWILNQLTDDERARYKYSRLDELYIERMRMISSEDDNIEKLRAIVQGRRVLVIAPGNTVNTHQERIISYIEEKNPVVISINFMPVKFRVDFAYFNNPRRYDYHSNSGQLTGKNTILTSNVIKKCCGGNGMIISVEKVVNGDNDNSTILLINLLDMLGVAEIALAGFDGFSNDGSNYISTDLEKDHNEYENEKIKTMYERFTKNKTVENVVFITPSIFELLDRSNESSD